MAKKEHKIILGLDARKFQSQMQKVQGEFKGLKSAVKGFATLWGAQIAGSFVMDMGKLGAEVVNVSEAFERMNKPALLNNLKTATGGLVSDLELMKQAIKFKNFGLPVQQLGTFLQFAAKQARETGQDIDYLVESLTIGLGRESIKILDNLQIDILQFKENFKLTGDYATALEMTIKQMGGNALPTAIDEATKLNTEFENLKNSLSVDILPLINDILWAVSAWVKGVKILAGGEFGLALDDATKSSEILKLSGDLIKDYKEQLKDKSPEEAVLDINKQIAKQQDKLNAAREKYNSTGGLSQESTKKFLQDAAIASNLVDGLSKMLDEQTVSVKDKNKELKKTKDIYAEIAREVENIMRVSGGGFSDFLTEQTRFGDLSGLENFEGLGDSFWDPAEIENFVSTLKPVTETMMTVANLAGDIAGNFARAIISGENFGEAMVQMLKNLAIQLAATAAVAAVLAVLTGGASGVLGGFGKIFAGMTGFGGSNKTTITGQDINIVSGRNKNFLTRTSGG